MRKKKLFLAGLVAGSVGMAGIGWAQSQSGAMDHSTMGQGGTMDHSAMDQGAMKAADASAAPVSEPGQGAFAAIAEIVATLEADPGTDWTRVDIAGLRAHLRDMDLVTIDAVAVAEKVDGGMRFTVTGAAGVAPSIRRMTLAHASVMGGVNDWEYSAREIDGGAEVTVLVPAQDQARIAALGFFGMMASGAHHQAHHWMMASGGDPHG